VTTERTDFPERQERDREIAVWIFFAEPVPASLARRLGAHLVTEAMERNPDIGFSSYDRFFPSQDNMPSGGFGNLIALSLQHGPRLRATASSSMRISNLLQINGLSFRHSDA
jgi:hypothetical protein